MSVTVEKQGGTAVITIDNPPVNALSHHVREGLMKAAEELGRDPDIDLIIMTGKGKAFIGGADIREFGQPPKDPDLNSVINTFEVLDKPVVAAVNGFALGGGLEVALGCHYRVAASNARVGIPEVKLGILPGAGGTQRLPRLAAMEQTIDMAVSGRHVPAAEALEAGIVDHVADGDLVAAAIEFGTGKPARPTRDLPVNTADVDWDALETKVRKSARGQESPIACLVSIKNAATMPFLEGLQTEREIFTRCVRSEQSRALRHAFFAERQLAKIPGLDPAADALPINKVGVIGAGTMGGGISMNFANVGIPVMVLEREADALERGLGICRKNYENSAAKGRISESEVEARMACLIGTTEMADLADCDLVIEAVFEKMELKKEIFSTLDKVVKPGAILASNTSTLDIDAIADTTNRPENVVGMHFFSPANVMKLLEVVRGSKSSDLAIKSSMTIGGKIGKVSVLAGNCDGFIGNRILHHYRREADAMLREGALPYEIDEAMRRFGMPMGIFQMGDLAGNDVGYLIRQDRKARGAPAEPMEALGEWLYQNNRYGQKTGKGWYLYEAGSRAPIRDEEVEAKTREVAASEGGGNRRLDEDEIMVRISHMMMNEGAKLLEEGIAIRSSDIDQTYIYGYGYPAWRGGPMFYIDDTVGLKAALERIEALYAKTGDENWAPAPLLQKLVSDGRTFAEYDAGQTA